MNAAGWRGRAGPINGPTASVGAFEDRHVLGAEVHHGDEAAFGLDATGVAADAALTLGGNSLDELARGIVDEQLILGRVGRRNDQSVLSVGGGEGANQRDQYAEKPESVKHYRSLL